jgi:hypothetical protein
LPPPTRTGGARPITAPSVQPVQLDIAWDLTPPVKEPAYRHEPRYALLVFGPDCEQRVWMVLDGTTLYVDRNGNGDLTEPNERVEPTNPRDVVGIRFAEPDRHEVFEFTVPTEATGTSKFRLDHWIRQKAGRGTTRNGVRIGWSCAGSTAGCRGWRGWGGDQRASYSCRNRQMRKCVPSTAHSHSW